MGFKKPKSKSIPQKGITLFTPNTFCPCNGRVVLQSEKGAMFAENASGIIVPDKTENEAG